ncbi:hypothetical protein RhiirA4_483851 [Rhizophagus irregularis]|uniref:Uncharacterized protein n=1 Tax=Rhizophagus irregularis TaxID=588596 RepID=A0A2I1HN45_9GLOM|nr:hypothetical protein RhiirA4_483851 [Rhizophagus irregularis]
MSLTVSGLGMATVTAIITKIELKLILMKKALELYQKAADLGNTGGGISNLILCYYETGPKAFELYQKDKFRK